MATSTSEIMNKGMKCLTEHLGIVEEISKEAAQFEHAHPFTGDAIRL